MKSADDSAIFDQLMCEVPALQRRPNVILSSIQTGWLDSYTQADGQPTLHLKFGLSSTSTLTTWRLPLIWLIHPGAFYALRTLRSYVSLDTVSQAPQATPLVVATGEWFALTLNPNVSNQVVWVHASWLTAINLLKGYIGFDPNSVQLSKYVIAEVLLHLIELAQNPNFDQIVNNARLVFLKNLFSVSSNGQVSLGQMGYTIFSRLKDRPDWEEIKAFNTVGLYDIAGMVKISGIDPVVSAGSRPTLSKGSGWYDVADIPDVDVYNVAMATSLNAAATTISKADGTNATLGVTHTAKINNPTKASLTTDPYYDIKTNTDLTGGEADDPIPSNYQDLSAVCEFLPPPATFKSAIPMAQKSALFFQVAAWMRPSSTTDAAWVESLPTKQAVQYPTKISHIDEDIVAASTLKETDGTDTEGVVTLTFKSSQPTQALKKLPIWDMFLSRGESELQARVDAWLAAGLHPAPVGSATAKQKAFKMLSDLELQNSGDLRVTIPAGTYIFVEDGKIAARYKTRSLTLGSVWRFQWQDKTYDCDPADLYALLVSDAKSFAGATSSWVNQNTTDPNVDRGQADDSLVHVNAEQPSLLLYIIIIILIIIFVED